VATDYEQLAGRYDEDRARWSVPRDAVIDELLAARGHARVLDLGCGTGRWLAAQHEAFGSRPVLLAGADPSTAMLAEARPKGLTGLVRARAEALPFADATFDYVASSYAFHHFVDKDRSLDEIGRVLSAGGILRVDNVEPAASQGWWVYAYFPETIAIDAARFWAPERIAAALEARGFIVDVEVHVDPQQVPAAEVLADAERRVISQLALLEDRSYAAGVERLRQIARAPDAVLTTTSARLSIRAVRAVPR
jgi:ubiquinone/menaquinone biosynthesis C-methylase UbiE